VAAFPIAFFSQIFLPPASPPGSFFSPPTLHMFPLAVLGFSSRSRPARFLLRTDRFMPPKMELTLQLCSAHISFFFCFPGRFFFFFLFFFPSGLTHRPAG